MTPAEADMLAAKITHSWPTVKIPASTWAEDIADLDAGYVGTALVQLRRTLDRPPTVAELRQHAKHLERNSPRHELAQPQGPAVSFAEHVALIARAARAGNPDALAELERWAEAADRANDPGSRLFRLPPGMVAAVDAVLSEVAA